MSKIDAYLNYIQLHQQHDHEGLLAMMTEDVEFHAAAGMVPPMQGKAAVRAWLLSGAHDVHDSKWRVLDYAESDTTLFVEGIEEHHDAAGQHFVIPYAGVLVFRGDLVCVWRDYFHGGLLRHGTAERPVQAHVQALADRPGAARLESDASQLESQAMTQSSAHLLDPELAALQQPLFAEPLSAEMLPAMRAEAAARNVLEDAASFSVERSEVTFTSADGTIVRGLLYRPEGAAAGMPGYVHIHGGGYIMGSVEASDPANVRIASRLGATVLSVAYRLAPEHSIPVPLEDCYAGLAWMHEQASELGVDPARIAIGGESAGGGLAAALAILARDRGEYAVCHQHLTYPMLDNLTGSEAQPGDPLTGEFVWTRTANQFGWQSYLGDAEPVAPQVPARVEDCAGLPPTWLLTVALDLFRDENIDYAQRLLAAGVPTELQIYPGACHGFQFVANAAVSRRFVRDHLQGLARGLGVTPTDG